MRNAPLIDRFMDKVHMEPMSGCWLWGGALFSNGYGFMSVGNRKASMHRLSWELHRGPIPDDLCVLHNCDNRACVNPMHLFVGTKGDNNADMHANNRDRCGIGERHGQAKITNEIVRAIRMMRASGATQKEVARHFGIAQSNVCLIVKRKTWTHVQ